MHRKILIPTLALLLYMGLTSLNNMDFYPPALQRALQTSDNKTLRLDDLSVTEQIRSQLPMGKFFRVADSATKRYVYVGRVQACRAGGCMDPVEMDGTIENYEYFDYFIEFDSSRTVQNVHVFNYQATHGQEITSKHWLRQFRNFNGSADLKVGKNVDGISGATVSVEAIVFDINHKTDLLHEMATE